MLRTLLFLKIPDFEKKNPVVNLTFVFCFCEIINYRIALRYIYNLLLKYHKTELSIMYTLQKSDVIFKYLSIVDTVTVYLLIV